MSGQMEILKFRQNFAEDSEQQNVQEQSMLANLFPSCKQNQHIACQA